MLKARLRPPSRPRGRFGGHANSQRESHSALRCFGNVLISRPPPLFDSHLAALAQGVGGPADPRRVVSARTIQFSKNRRASLRRPFLKGTFPRYYNDRRLSTPTAGSAKKLLPKCWSNRPPSRGGYHQAGLNSVADRPLPVNRQPRSGLFRPVLSERWAASSCIGRRPPALYRSLTRWFWR